VLPRIAVSPSEEDVMVATGDKNPAAPGNKKPADDEMPDFSDVQSGASSTAPAAQAFETYVVVKGDTLSKIAKRVYGSANSWQKIFEANTDVLKDPNKIFPGQKLKIPAKS
jgi:nucleoid-associated protein YgaU